MLWSSCNGPAHIKPIAGTLFRMVESQEQVATRGYVDTLDEQAVLEELLDSTKPEYPEDTDTLHYLLKTPFRYPPLPWGSRFGRAHEPSLFYGGRSIQAMLAESAYYRLVHLFAMEGPAPKHSLKSEHSVFSVGYATAKGIQLQAPPFIDHTKDLKHLSQFTVCQQLGSDMRTAGIDAFEYLSARSQGNATCVALFNPTPFTGRSPAGMEQWFCETSHEGVVFKATGSRNTTSYPTDQFSDNGEFPMPA